MSVSVQEGDLIADRYRLEKFIEAGGISRAWLARDDLTDEPVVIKFPNYDSANDPRIVKQGIEQEMDVLEQIQKAGGHPNVMELVERTSVDGEPVMVVGFVSGEEMLEAVRKRNGFGDPEDVRQVGVALCQAMSFLHENEIIYRDLKPDNVILQPDMTPVLIDFNTAKGFKADASGDAAGAGTVIPNPTYKPPELNNDPELVGYRQGPWSDVYSIGKVLMFMFSASAARGHAIDPRDFPGTRSVPPYLAEIIQRATGEHKDDRYRNATVLARVLENRDPEPPDVAKIVHLQEGETYDIYPGDTIGRRTSDGPRPSIILEDPKNYISAVQVQFNTDRDGNWILQDRSLNGTWVKRRDDWHRVLSKTGRERLEEKGKAGPELAKLPEKIRLAEGDRIALVHPKYGVWLEFRG